MATQLEIAQAIYEYNWWLRLGHFWVSLVRQMHFELRNDRVKGE
jgi:hypothetical protein